MAYRLNFIMRLRQIRNCAPANGIHIHNLNITSLEPANNIRCITIGNLTIADLIILLFVKLIEQVI